jgi:hypothetical protein
MVSVFPTTSSRKTGLYFSTLQNSVSFGLAKKSVFRTREVRSQEQQRLLGVLERRSELRKGLRSPL